MDFLNRELGGNPIYLYFISLLIIVAAILCGMLLRSLGRGRLKARAAASKNKLDDILVALLERPLSIFTTIFGVYVGLSTLKMPPAFEMVVRNTLLFAITLFFILTASRIVKYFFASFVMPKVEETASTLDNQVAILARKMTITLLWIVGILIILSNMGYNVVSIWTGLGLGGLAVAMASKDTLANVFGGVTIIIDKPIKLGDTVSVSGSEAVVEEIGLRTTRIRTWTGHLVSIPNSKVADSVLENISARPALRVRFKLGFAYNTSLEKVLAVPEIICGVIEEVEGVHTEKKPSVHLIEFADSSLNYQITYFIQDASRTFPIQHEVNTGILAAVHEHGLEIPFQTLTIYQGSNAALEGDG